MKIQAAKIEVWNGCSFQWIDFQMAQTQNSLGAVQAILDRTKLRFADSKA
ncbi:hypothetical protein [Acaryochloris marina]|uniref:Uncharacterized protein n=1 Tax=Acaryochloris marina (strain MBIC 11017) TaxID=329726 RepID=A8ZPZ6_ACAM1|nr:hypothetical protein [Acaryochloris marina]ABW33169.1 hypothetical protein AM1_F0013 [Acaryochloris marina MBIC11017]BDM83222.1 hypothetical protein AM10699_60830 [Acaryochloris marina MBIC10699]